jgi:dihydrofolate reductase
MDDTKNESLNLSSPLGDRGMAGGEPFISLLVAADEGNVIGKDNKLPWHLPADLKYFKNLTWGMPIVMGRKTFESIGKPLPGRTTIVITRNQAWAFENVSIVHSLDEAIAVAGALNVKELFVIGGAEIFTTALPQAARIYRTRIHHRFEGDVVFPDFAATEWGLVKSHRHEPDEKNKYGHTFEVWERKEPA